MARPQKKGLDYFPFDVDTFSSDEFRLIQAEFGNNGVMVVLHVFCKIYKENGYYYKWGDDQCLLLAAGAGVVPNFVKEVLDGCFRRSIFDDRVFKMFEVLTSHGIQMRYFEVAKKSKLSNIDIQEDFLLINEDDKNRLSSIFDNNKFGINPSKFGINSEISINSELIPVNSELTPVNSELTTQIKEKKRKINNNTTTREANDFFKKNEVVSKKNNSEEMKQELLSNNWLEQVCIGQNVKMDEFKPFVDNYVKMKILIGDFDNYKIMQHKRFVISDFNKEKSDKIKNTQNVRTTRQVSPKQESVLEYNKRAFNELVGECATDTV